MEMPSGASANGEEHSSGSLREVTELAAGFGRVFAGYRLYGHRHERALEMESEFFRSLSAFVLEHHELTLQVLEHQFRWRDAKVLEDDRKDESITQALYADGVESISFFRGLEAEEFQTFMTIWQRALRRELGVEHSFSTSVWEEDFQNISAVFQPGLIERTADPQARERREGRVARVVHALAHELRPSGDSTIRRVVFAPSALAGLTQVEAFRGLDAQELERRAKVEAAPVIDLTEADKNALVSTMGTSVRGQGQRTLYGLWCLFPGGARSQRAEIVDFATRIIGTLLEMGRVDDTVRAMTRIEDVARGTPRSERLFEEFLTSMSDEDVVRYLAKESSDPERSGPALGLLRLVPSTDVDLLFELLSGASGRVREFMAQLIIDKNPSPEALAQWLQFERGEGADQVFRIARTLGETHLDMVIRSGAIHDEDAVRMLALGAIAGERVQDYWSLMQTCAEDPSVPVRQSAMVALLKSRDQRGLDVAREQLARPEAPRALLISIVRGLGHLGVSESQAILRQTLESHPDREVRAASALALVNGADEQTIEVLERHARRLFRERVVRDAAVEALRRLSAREGGDSGDS